MVCDAELLLFSLFSLCPTLPALTTLPYAEPCSSAPHMGRVAAKLEPRAPETSRRLMYVEAEEAEADGLWDGEGGEYSLDDEPTSRNDSSGAVLVSMIAVLEAER